jgi:hypothetical protein
MQAHETGGRAPERRDRGHNYDGVRALATERVHASAGRNLAKRLLPAARMAGYEVSARNFCRLVGARAQWRLCGVSCNPWTDDRSRVRPRSRWRVSAANSAFNPGVGNSMLCGSEPLKCAIQFVVNVVDHSCATAGGRVRPGQRYAEPGHRPCSAQKRSTCFSSRSASSAFATAAPVTLQSAPGIQPTDRPGFRAAN